MNIKTKNIAFFSLVMGSFCNSIYKKSNGINNHLKHQKVNYSKFGLQKEGGRKCVVQDGWEIATLKLPTCLFAR